MNIDSVWVVYCMFIKFNWLLAESLFIKEGRFEILWTGLTLPHFWSCLKSGARYMLASFAWKSQSKIIGFFFHWVKSIKFYKHTINNPHRIYIHVSFCFLKNIIFFHLSKFKLFICLSHLKMWSVLNSDYWRWKF
jgi:hypothetical protein